MKKIIAKEILKAVHDYDLEQLLQNLDLLEKIRNNQLKCKFCKNVVTLENLHSIFPQSGNIQMVCDNPDCIRQLFDFLRNDTELL